MAGKSRGVGSHDQRRPAYWAGVAGATAFWSYSRWDYIFIDIYTFIYIYTYIYVPCGFTRRGILHICVGVRELPLPFQRPFGLVLGGSNRQRRPTHIVLVQRAF